MLTISAESRKLLMDYENDPKKPDMRMAMIEDEFVPSDDCYLQPDGNYKITEGAWRLAANHGLTLPTIKTDTCPI